MPLKNYTSTVPAERSMASIESKLVRAGARQVLKHYDETGSVESMMFILAVNGHDMPFKLPARVAEYEKMLRHKWVMDNAMREQFEHADAGRSGRSKASLPHALEER